jgi:7,8-didemethyl-8-hydroxy-5-deazariboflavin synthase CofG subunit
MLESTNPNLEAHADRTPDKVPSKRLAVIEDAGKLGIPFTTGILIGLGESFEDRVQTLFAIRNLHDRYGHVQEVIIQNFRAKSGIPMSSWPEPTDSDMLRTVAVARLILRDMNIQAPPNLSSPDYARLLDAGINDWGGVSPLTPDFINPEAPWPHLAELEQQTNARGFTLKQRLPVYPEFVLQSSTQSRKSAAQLRALADERGYARELARTTLP